MRDSKSSLLLLVSLILFLMSFIILCTWGYNTYYRTKEEKHKAGIRLDDSTTIAKATSAIANATRDSLQRIYMATIKELDSKLDSTYNYADSLKGPLDLKLDEFFKLRNEIAIILKDKSTNANLGVARQKINELQRRVEELIGRNKDVENENKRLYAMLKQLSVNMKEQEPQNARAVVFENRPGAESNTGNVSANANLFMAADLRLSALMETDNNKELETYQALQTDKLVGSFIVKNDNNPNSNDEVVVVVIQPDGKVLQKSSWESGTFNTRDGRKIYSCKVRFDYNKGEAKRLNFSLSSDKYLKGSYIMQIYYNGTMIGKLSKTLS
jgi:TolA-binding protein